MTIQDLCGQPDTNWIFISNNFYSVQKMVAGMWEELMYPVSLVVEAHVW